MDSNIGIACCAVWGGGVWRVGVNSGILGVGELRVCLFVGLCLCL